VDLNFWRSLSPVFVMIAFAGVCWWAYTPKHRKQFEEAARLPFADEPQAPEPSRSVDNQQ